MLPPKHLFCRFYIQFSMTTRFSFEIDFDEINSSFEYNLNSFHTHFCWQSSISVPVGKICMTTCQLFEIESDEMINLIWTEFYLLFLINIVDTVRLLFKRKNATLTEHRYGDLKRLEILSSKQFFFTFSSRHYIQYCWPSSLGAPLMKFSVY